MKESKSKTKNSKVTAKKAPKPTPARLIEKEKKDAMKLFDGELFVEARVNADGIKMSIWDYGGQEVFYTLHHLFLTQYGVYMLVVNANTLGKFSISNGYHFVAFSSTSIC